MGSTLRLLSETLASSLHCHLNSCHTSLPQNPCLALNSLNPFYPNLIKVLLLRPMNPWNQVTDVDAEAFRGAGGHPSPLLSQGQPGLATRADC